MKVESNIIIYNTVDGKAKVALYAKDGTIWMNQNQIAELFGKGRTTVVEHIQNIFTEGELEEKAVCRKFRQTAFDGKDYNTSFDAKRKEHEAIQEDKKDMDELNDIEHKIKNRRLKK